MSPIENFFAKCSEHCICSHDAIAKGTCSCWMSCFEVHASCNKNQKCKVTITSEGPKIAERE